MATRRPLAVLDSRTFGELPDEDQIPAANVPGSAVGKAVLAVADPDAETFLRINADNSVTLRSAADFRGDLALGALATMAVESPGPSPFSRAWVDLYASASEGLWATLKMPASPGVFGRRAVVESPSDSAGEISTTVANTIFCYDGTTLDFRQISPSYITGLGTMATQNANAVAITGGTINGASVGATTPSTGAFTTLSTTGNVTLGDATSDVHTVNGRITSSAIFNAGISGSVPALRASGAFGGGFSLVDGSLDSGLYATNSGQDLALFVGRNTSSEAATSKVAMYWVGNKLGIAATTNLSAQMNFDGSDRGETINIFSSASAGTRTGWGKWSFESRFYIPSGDRFTWYGGGPTGAELMRLAGSGGLSITGTLTATGTITAAKSLLVDDVYQITAVTTASQTRTVDLANGATQTLSVNQACTLNATGPAGKAGHLMLVIYNSAGSSSACSFGTGWYPTSGALLPNGTNTQVTHLWWDGTRMAPLFDSNFPGDLRPT